MSKSTIFFSLIFVISSLSLSAQTKKILLKEKKQIIDLKGKSHYGSIILFDDFSTEWVESTSSMELSTNDSLRNTLAEKAINSEIFNNHWSNKSLFPYPSQNFHTMNDSIKIHLLQDSDFFMPPNDHIFSPFGWRRGRQHKGIDLDLDVGDTLRSVFSGKVRFSDYNNGGYGNLVIIRHFNGLETYYAHLDKLIIKPNDIVLAGDVIGLGGETGNALGPHLHFEVRYKDVAFDPKNIIDFTNNSLVSNFDDEGLPTYFLTKSDFAWVATNKRKKYYKLKAGDYLGKVAAKYGITVSKILRLNPKITNPNTLQIGQSIRVR